MSEENLTLYVASYADADTAASDYQSLKSAESGDDLVIVGSVVLSRDADGNVDVKETGGAHAASGALIGGGTGLIVGLFAPPLLLATAIGAGAGAIVGELTKRHEEKKMGADLDEYLAPGSSAIVVVLDDEYVDGVDKALTKADKKVNKAIDSGDYDKLQKALQQGGDEVSGAIDS